VLSDLRESGSLEQDADIVMFINRPNQMDESSPYRNIAKLAVANIAMDQYTAASIWFYRTVSYVP